VLMGGPSAERGVSLRSGAAVAKGLREAGYEVTEVELKDRSVTVPKDAEAVFIAMHGEFGEDGGVQKVLEQAGIPKAIVGYWTGSAGDIQPMTVAVVAATLVVSIAIVVFFERAQRHIPIQYARRQVGSRIYGGKHAHLPLRVNMASMIPPIFASSLLMFPATLSSFNIPGMQLLSGVLNRGDWVFQALFGLLIVFFTFFYTAVTFRPVDVADNLKKQQANIPGIRPGKQTAEFIDGVISRLTVGGATYLAAICIIPSLIIQAVRVPFQFGGTSLIIVVGVALETVNQIEAHLLTHSYEGLTGPTATKLSGRRPA